MKSKSKILDLNDQFECQVSADPGSISAKGDGGNLRTLLGYLYVVLEPDEASRARPGLLTSATTPSSLLALFISISRMRLTFCSFHNSAPTCSSLYWRFELDLSFLPTLSTSWVCQYLSRCTRLPKLQVLFQVCAEHSKSLQIN